MILSLPSFFGSLILYITIYNKFNLELVNWMSVIHSLSCLLVMVAPEHVVSNSIAYFLVDTYQTPSWMWKIHHLIAIGFEWTAIIGTTNFFLWSPILLYSEIGAVLYHFSRIFKDSIFVRIIFILGYSYSRISLFDFIITYFYEVPIYVQFGCIVLIVMNTWFLVTQVRMLINLWHSPLRK